MKKTRTDPHSDEARAYVAALLRRVRDQHRIPAGKFPGRGSAATKAVFDALEEAAKIRKTTHGPDDAMYRVLEETLTAADCAGDLPGWHPWDWFEHAAQHGSIGKATA